MNTQLKVSLFIMLVIALFSIGGSFMDSPAPDSDGKVDGGTWTTGADGITRFTTDGGTVYRIFKADGYQIYDPFVDESLPFGSWDEDADWSDRQLHDNVDDFYKDIGVGGGTPTKQKIYDIFSTAVLWGIVLGILGATVALGVSVFGTGLSEFSQKTAFLGLAYGLLWGFLTSITWDVLNNGSLSIFGNLIYIVLTLLFIIGVVAEVTTGGE